MITRTIGLTVAASLLAVTSTYAQTSTSSKEKVAIYKSCQKNCVEKQNTMAVNRHLLELPFVLEHYCGCFCSRFAMRVSAEDVAVMGRLSLEGKSIENHKVLKKVMEKSTEVCMDAFF